MKEIEGYGGLYKVDEEGNIYGHRNKIVCVCGGIETQLSEEQNERK